MKPVFPNCFAVLAADSRIQMPHLCVYTALVQQWALGGFVNPFVITRSTTMRLAKMRSKTTYHQCLKTLQEGRYIDYLPSYHPKGKSLVFMNFEY